MAISQHGVRLGTKRRKQLTDAYAARGHLRSQLVYAYSPRMQQDVVLKSWLEFGHFILAESDPYIQSIEYNPPCKEIAQVGDDNIGTLFDAYIHLTDGTLLWREIKYSREEGKRAEHQRMAQEALAYRAGAIYERVTEKDIYKNPLWISNWIEVVAWLSSVRGRPTIEFDLAVANFFAENRVATIKELQAFAGEPTEEPFYIAAAFRLLQAGSLSSDLDSAPLTARTRLRQTSETG